MKLLPIVFVLSFLCLSNTYISEVENIENNNPLRDPRVFLIDENELLYERLTAEYNTFLLTACDNDMNKAIKVWNKTLTQMQNYAIRWNYYNSIIGVKIWIRFFCDKKGRIQHIGYAVKPGSRNVDTELFSKFLARFIRVYRFNIRTNNKFSHYHSISFPVKL